MAVSVDNLTSEQLARVQKAQAGGPITDAKLLEILAGEARDDGGAETAAMLGGGYRLGGVEIPPLSAGALVLLDLIDSPFLQGRPGAISSIDVAAAVYVLAVGPEAVRPIMGLARRQRGIQKAERLAENSPDHYREYLAACERIGGAWGEFEFAALEFWASLGKATMQEGADLVMQAISDAFGGFELLPQEGEGSKKNALTRSGSGKSATSAAASGE